jgi:Ca2+-binding RTX toxin-like protein
MEATGATRLRRRRNRRGVVRGMFLVTLVFAAYGIVVPQTAGALAMCAFLLDTATVTMLGGGSAIIGVDTTPNPDIVLFDDDASLAGATQCGSANVTNADTILVSGSAANDKVVIDLSGGDFQDNNDFEIDLLVGSDTLMIGGSATGDSLVFGADGINVDGDATADVTSPGLSGLPSGVENYRVKARAGGDTATGAGGSGTGARFPQGLAADGGAGGDSLVGGNGDDHLRGGRGRDEARGEAGKDLLRGGPGRDSLRGGVGRDILRGGPSTDVCRGGSGRDLERSCER